MSKLWLVKDKKGRIFGPYSEKEICFYIEEGEFKGEELLSSYPAGKWKPISVHSVFYEKILEKLNAKPSSSSEKSLESSNSSSSSFKEENEDPIEPTRILNPKDSSSSKTARPKHKIKLSKEFKEELLLEREDDIIEMENVKGKFFDKLKSSLKIPLLVFTALAFLTFFLFGQDDNKAFQERVRLMTITKKRNPLPKKDIKKIFQSAMLAHLKGNVSHYLKSQSQYVRILEGNPEELEIYTYLCLIYLEIWPFAYQDTRDKKALKDTLNLIGKRDKGGIYSGFCKSVQALIDKNPEKSLSITNSSLNVMNNKVPIFFYYIKAKALKALNRRSEVSNYLRSIHKLRPEWTAPYMLSAEMFYEKNKYDMAGKLYQKILSIFPEHTSAGLRMGVLEYKYFKKIEKSESRLKSILLNLDDFVLPNILISAYVALANIYLKKNDKEKVLKYTNKAYALDPEHPDVMMLKSKLGEEDVFKNTKVKTWGLIYKGDVLVAQGKCSSAKNYFSKAYKAEKQKNAQAALRMAQCYWQSKASGQAIRWLKRAINADSKELEAYFLLSDYLSELYDFESAREILNSARSQNPSSYDLFKAYALLSFRQKRYQPAIAYAKKSLNFYTSDIEIYILLSKAYKALKKGSKAFYYANRAIEEDINNVQAQIVYSLALDLAYGFHKAENNFKQLIRQFPMIIEYSQALGEYYFNKDMYEKAQIEFENIIKKTPAFKPAYIYLGRIYSYLSYKKGKKGEKYEKALRYFLEANLLDISDPEPLFYMAQSHLQHEQYQLAENQFEKVLKTSPNYPLIHYYIGLVNFYQQGEENLEKALRFARIQSSKTPDHFLPYKLSGDVYKLKSQGAFENFQEKRITYELCAKEYQKALKYIKNDIEISISLIECYKGSGNLSAALELGMGLIKQEGLSGYSQLYKEIAEIYEAKDQYEKARSYYMAYFTLNPGAKDRAEIESRINRLMSDKKKISEPKVEE